MAQKDMISYKDIKLTFHAKQRAEERLGIKKESEIQKLAHSARYKGIKIKSLNKNNYTNFGMSYELYKYLKNHYGHYHNSERIYYYKKYVYIFAGNGSKSLKSIVPCLAEEIALSL